MTSLRLVRRLALVFAFTFVLLEATGCSSTPKPQPQPHPDEPASHGPEAPGTCAHCGLPLYGEVIDWRGKAYHAACYDFVGPVCQICRRVIHGRHVVLAKTLPYHEECLSSTPRCESCGLPAGGERGSAPRWEDGRITCRTCRTDAALESTEARQVLLQARKSLTDVLGLDVGGIETPVVLTSCQDLAARAGTLAHDGLKALTEVEERGGSDSTRGERRYRIFALYGLARTGLRGVLAHELFHVLQSEATANTIEPALREGAANYVQVRVLLSLGEDVRARLLEEDHDSIYGEGLRRFERLAREKGEKDALDVGLHGPRFPDGY